MLKQHRKNLTQWQFHWGKLTLGLLSLVVPIMSWELAGHFAAVAEAEAEPAKQRAAATADVAGHFLM